MGLKLIERIFEQCMLIELVTRDDVRGNMEISYNEDDLKEITGGFSVKGHRIYRMPHKHTFFGIHFQKGSFPQSKLVSVLQGSAMDFVVDLRRDSVTYRQSRCIELCGSKPTAVYIPAGFGHAFLSLEDDTVQLFSVNEYFRGELTGVINCKDPSIGLKLPFENIIMSEKDRQAGYLE